MAVLVDYRCPACGSDEERWVSSPPPSHSVCGACGAESRRVWSPVGLCRSVGLSTPPAATSVPQPPGSPSLASRLPHVPGLCHLDESAGRMLVAKMRGDTQSVENEHAHQEKVAARRQPTMADLAAHQHTPSPS